MLKEAHKKTIKTGFKKIKRTLYKLSSAPIVTGYLHMLQRFTCHCPATKGIAETYRPS